MTNPQNFNTELGHADDDLSGEDDGQCVMWHAINPETCVPELVVPFSFYQGLEDRFNELVVQLRDHQHAHVLSKLALTDFGQTIGAQKLRINELEQALAARS